MSNAAHPLIIDSFAGGGGASTGIEMALGVSPDYAINHSEAALALHAANHPETEHLQTSIYAVDPREIVKKSQRVGLAWFSPDCKHFSKARGGTPVNKNIRDLAWVVVHWAELVRPEVIALENVEEFQTWAPLRQMCDAQGNPRVDGTGQPLMEPDPERKGETFKLWVRRLRKLGYKVQWRELRACDYGAATIRKRLFLIARCDGRPIVWPQPTHGDPKSAAVKKGKLMPWRTAAECIDWSIPCPSIFDTAAEIKDKLGLKAKRPLADNTEARIARGMKRYVLDAAKPFVVNLTHGARLEDADAPLRTITAAQRGENALVAPSIVRHFGASLGQRCDSPAPTTTAGGGGKSGLIAPSLMSLKGTARRDSPVTAPHPTVLAGGGHSAVVAPILSYAQQGGRNRSAKEPAHTFTASRKDQNAIIAPMLVQTGYGERKGQAPRALDPIAPLGTIVAGGVKHAPAAAFLAQHNKAKYGVNPGRPIDVPISTLTATGSHQMIVAPWFAKYFGTATGTRSDEPCHTISTRDRFGHMQAALTAPEFAPEHEVKARKVAEFLRKHDAWDGGEFVTLEIDGQTFVVVDIGMRMLTPRELFAAQGFPSDYVIEGVWDQQGDEWIWQPFSKTVQVSCCGNSVSPFPACALIQANCGHLVEELQRKAA
ncbi:DNA cytosine methyltransferase [Ruegeria marisrubri]|uniref:DNA cytosine methyltransferase n=1 Tax=Ruegeria marisrubri TaxID=1685379 RepID=UPI001CD80D1C|nr:DNA cytosine methyltransferase [Ruegeria marisrubri]MCA0905158.1 DNA cytosine methyltransferase [Ruegeria marisrubri]